LRFSAVRQSTAPHLFSPKLIPWFVSDVTPADFIQAITSLLDRSFFDSAVPSDSSSSAGHGHLKHMVTRWKTYIDQGVFSLSVPMDTPLGGDRSDMSILAEFWTTPWPYWQMKDHAPELFQSLGTSDLVIFKVVKISNRPSFLRNDILVPRAI
jgi:hypothetical protein